MYFDKIIKHLNNYNDVLLQHLETALKEFLRTCGELFVKTCFNIDFNDMPKRIKRARDALVHGNNTHQITENTSASNNIYANFARCWNM